MAREAKVLITSSNNAGAGIKSAINDLTSLESNSVRIAKKIQEAFTAVAVAAAAKQVVQFGIEAVKAFGEVERKMTQLKVALGGNDASFDRLNKHIQNLSRVTLDSKGDIQAMVAQLAALGKSDKDIERISEAAVKLSNVTGVGLNEAMKQVNATFSGTAGQLSKLIPELGTMTKEQLAAGDAVDLLNTKFKDVSDSMAGGVSQSLKNLTDNFGDLKENIGESLLKAFTPMINGINATIEGWNRAYDSHKRYKKALLDDPELARLLKAEADRKRILDAFNPDTIAGQAQLAGNPRYLENLKKAYEDATKTREAYEASLLPPATAGVRGVAAPDLSLGAGGKAGGKGANDLPDYITIGEYNNFPMPADPEYYMGEYNIFPQPAGPAAERDSSGGVDFGFDFASPLMEMIGPLADMFGGLLGPLASVQAIMDPLGTILGSMMEVLGPLIDEALEPVIGVLKIFGKIFAAVLIPVLNILTPIIKLNADMMLWFANKIIIPVGNLFIAIMRGIILALNKIPGVNIKKPGYIDTMSLDDASDTGPGSTTGTGASYTGSQPIIFNFYNQGNVVGSGGFEELAEIIDGLIKRNARYA